jgi:hypothetical protein
MGSGRIVGIILLAVGIILGVAIGAWLLAGQGEEKLSGTAVIFGLVLMLILVLPFLAGGAYMLIKGQGEAREYAEIEKEKRLLNMVSTQGKVQLPNAAVEMNLSMDQVKAYVYDLVGKGLFTGYIDWKSSTLFAADAAKVGSTTCPNCGGVRELAGKGVVKCPYCGAELFLPQ